MLVLVLSLCVSRTLLRGNTMLPSSGTIQKAVLAPKPAFPHSLPQPEKSFQVCLDVLLHLLCRFPPFGDSQILGYPVSGEITASTEYQTSRISGSSA